MVGRVIEVLVEDFQKGYFIAKTDGGKTIKIKNENVELGDFYNVKINKALTNELIGEIV